MIDLGISRIAPVAADRIEKRASNFTDTLIAGLLARAGGTQAVMTAQGAVEVAAGLWARSFAAATVSPTTALTSPLGASWRAGAARELCRRGEACFLIVVDGGGVELVPAVEWDVRGLLSESGWYYSLTLAGPDGTVTRTVPGESVVHLRYACDPSSPWAGRSPLSFAAETGQLGANLERALADEASSPVGALIPVPRQDASEDDDDADNDTLALLQNDISKLRGKPALVETTAAAWGEGRINAPMTDWKSQRVGANPPAGLITLREGVQASVLSIHGIPPGLLSGRGASSRESLRLFFRTTVIPLARIIEGELRRKLDPAVEFSFADLAAADVSTAARATGVLVKAGIPVDEARKLSGLD